MPSVDFGEVPRQPRFGVIAALVAKCLLYILVGRESPFSTVTQATGRKAWNSVCLFRNGDRNGLGRGAFYFHARYYMLGEPMPTESSIVRVFVSSTSEDLKSFRAVARDAVLKIGWVPVMMEYFTAVPEATVQACCDKLAPCQVLLLIQAFRRGWTPTKEQGGDGVQSMTALEVAYANEPQHKIDILALLANKTWPGDLWEDEQAKRKRVEDFRNELNRVANFFDHEKPTSEGDLPQFRSTVTNVLLAHKQRLLERRIGGHGAEGVDFFDSARDAIVKGRGVPFIGAGIYGDGPLGTPALIKALLGDAEPEPSRCLATVAEYRERYLDDRRSLLEQLTDQVRIVPSTKQQPAVLEMLLRVKAPELIVVATYDQMLEEQLRAAKRRFAVVAHVMHSDNPEDEGKIAVFRDELKTEICGADKVKLESDELWVYRPLGSPLLSAAQDPDRAIDTVVITEADHLSLLSRLENQQTTVPSAFSRPLQLQPVVFMGYGLDVWHYRLVMRLLEKVGTKRRPIAVRKPASPMEELAWKRLGADLARSDPNDFARRVLEELQPA